MWFAKTAAAVSVLQLQQENVQWIMTPLHYRRSDGGTTWRVIFEKIIGLLSSVPPLARWRECAHPGIAITDKDTVRGGQLENGTSLSKSHLGKAHLWDVHQGVERV